VFDLEQGIYERCRYDHPDLGSAFLLFKLDTIRPKSIKTAIAFSDDEEEEARRREEAVEGDADAGPRKKEKDEFISSGDADANYRARHAEEELYLQTDKDQTEEIHVGDYVVSKFGHERQLYSGEIIAIKPLYKPRNSDVEIPNPTPYQLKFDDRTQAVWKRREAFTKIDDSSFNIGDRKLLFNSPVYWVRYGGAFGMYEECSIKYYNRENKVFVVEFKVDGDVADAKRHWISTEAHLMPFMPPPKVTKKRMSSDGKQAISRKKAKLVGAEEPVEIAGDGAEGAVEGEEEDSSTVYSTEQGSDDDDGEYKADGVMQAEEDTADSTVLEGMNANDLRKEMTKLRKNTGVNEHLKSIGFVARNAKSPLLVSTILQVREHLAKLNHATMLDRGVSKDVTVIAPGTKRGAAFTHFRKARLVNVLLDRHIMQKYCLEKQRKTRMELDSGEVGKARDFWSEVEGEFHDSTKHNGIIASDETYPFPDAFNPVYTPECKEFDGGRLADEWKKILGSYNVAEKRFFVSGQNKTSFRDANAAGTCFDDGKNEILYLSVVLKFYGEDAAIFKANITKRMAEDSSYDTMAIHGDYDPDCTEDFQDGVVAESSKKGKGNSSNATSVKKNVVTPDQATALEEKTKAFAAITQLSAKMCESMSRSANLNAVLSTPTDHYTEVLKSLEVTAATESSLTRWNDEVYDLNNRLISINKKLRKKKKKHGGDDDYKLEITILQQQYDATVSEKESKERRIQEVRGKVNLFETPLHQVATSNFNGTY